MRIIASVVFLLGMCVWGWSAEYYVDAQNGRDTFSGTSPQEAWQSVARVNRAKLEPGDTVRFRSGQMWRESIRCQSGAENEPITYTSYGEGAKPEFRRSLDICPAKYWEKAGENLWRTVPGKQMILGKLETFAPRDWHLYREGEVQAKLTQNRNEAGEAVYTLHVEQTGKTAPQIQFTNSAFPLVGNQGIVFRFRAKATKPFVMNHISLMKAAHPWNAYASGTHSVKVTEEWQEFAIYFQTHNTFEEVNDGRVTFFLGTSIPSDCTFSFVPLGASLAEWEGLNFDADVGNIILTKKGETKKFAGFKKWSIETLENEADFYFDSENRTIYFRSAQNPSEVYSEMEAALRHGIFQFGAQKHLVIDGLAGMYTAAHGANGASAEDVTIRRCDFGWIGGGLLYVRNGRPTRYGNGIEFWCAAKDCLVEQCRFWQVYDVAMSNQGPDPCRVENVVWRQNTVFRCEQAYEIWFTNPKAEIDGLVFENNTCVDSGFGWSHVQRPDIRGTHLLAYGFNPEKHRIIYRHNLFCNAANHMIDFVNPRLNEFHCDHNIFWQEGENPEKQPLFRWKGEQGSVDFAEYQRLTGNDLHSAFRKPVFRNAAQDDYEITNRAELGNAGRIDN
ncbi:MAG: hypothetical protein Q4D62_14125 [Planctomycetia bacterium]|nr:hypothetical protein [Planctomycetia bacterium]